MPKHARATIVCFFSLLFVLSTFPRLARAETILVLGDSHTCSTPFGPQIAKDLERKGANNVIVYCSGGTSAQYWIRPEGSRVHWANRCMTYNSKNIVETPLSKPSINITSVQMRSDVKDANGNNTGSLGGRLLTDKKGNVKTTGMVRGATACVEGKTDIPPLDKLLAKVKPDRVVVALGTNNLGLNAMDSFSKFAKQIAKTQAKCSWIGPPALGTKGYICANYRQNLPGLIDKISSSVKESCNFVDSRPFTKKTDVPDCPHRHGPEAVEWAHGVSSEIISSSASGGERSATPRSSGRQ